MRRDWPFVGRTHELEAVNQVLARGDRSGIVLVGPPGVGKTRLADECLAIAERSGFATILVRATRSAAAVPLGAFAHLLPPDVAGDGRSATLARASGHLASLGDGRPLVLGVDDAHLLDEPSAALVGALAATDGAFVVATLRSGEVAPDAVVAMWEDGVAERLEVPALVAPDAEALVTAILGGEVDATAVDRLVAAADGNALYLREVIAGAVDEGTLTFDAGRWHLGGSLAPTTRLVELVQERLGRLDTAAQRALEVVALAEPADVDLLTGLVEPAQLDALATTGFARLENVDGRTVARLAHPLHGDVVRTSLPALRARAVKRSLADAAEATGRAEELRAALWRIEGGGTVDAPRMLASTHRARGIGDLLLAERLCSAAIEAGAGFEAQLLGAELASIAGRSDEAEARLAALAAQPLDAADHTLVVTTWADIAVFGRRLPNAARDAVERAGGATAGDDVAARSALLDVLTGDVASGGQLGESLLEHATGRPRTVAAIAAGLAHAVDGRADAAWAAATLGAEAHAGLRGSPLLWHPAVHDATRSLAAQLAGDARTAADIAARLRDFATAEGWATVLSWFEWLGVARPLPPAT